MTTVSAPEEQDRFFRIQHVLARIPVSRNTIYRMMDRGEFPKCFPIGSVSFWLESEVLDWMTKTKDTRRGALAPPEPKPKRRAVRKPVEQSMFADILG